MSTIQILTGEMMMDRRETADTAVIALDDPGAIDSEVTGAKAAALARATAAGLPVLAGMVVTTRALAPDDDGIDPLRADIEPDLWMAWLFVSDGGRRPIVVRSSSTIEDNANSSMAGMFTSVLDVASWDDFRIALDVVLASSSVVSLTDPDANSQVRAPMAVLVQPQLAPTVGGVLFGLDPVSGRRDRLVVSASEAGPSAVVSGEVDGTRYVLSPRGRRLEGPSDHPADGAAGPLRAAQLRQLADLARHAENVFGGPQDIEWAFGPDGRLWLLQSRPITAAATADRGHGPVLGPGPVAETFPDALASLEEDLWVGPLREGLRAALALAGTAPKRRLATSPVVTTAGGRVAADLELLGAVDGPTSFVHRLDPRPPARRLVAAWRVGRLRAALPDLADDLLATADRDLLDVPALSTLSDRELLALLDRTGPALSALHGHEVLMGWLITPTSVSASTITAASVALRALASSRAEGMTDDEIIDAYPGVLALVPPRIGTATVLPAGLVLPIGGGESENDVEPDRATVLREALRLRARWVQELTAKVAEELGRRLVARGVLADAASVRHLRLAELTAAVRTGHLPAEIDLGAIDDRAHAAGGAPLPTRFRLTDSDDVVPVMARARKRRRHGASNDRFTGGTGAGGGRGMGPVHGGDGPPDVGSVLVVRTLDPGLAPLLPRLGGLVAETGSFLSHLAILARELNVPTVVGVDDALDRFPAGTIVVVDGTTGQVSRLETERGAA